MRRSLVVEVFISEQINKPNEESTPTPKKQAKGNPKKLTLPTTRVQINQKVYTSQIKARKTKISRKYQWKILCVDHTYFAIIGDFERNTRSANR